MKLRIFCLLIMIVLVCSNAIASDKLHVEALDEFSTASPSDTINVRMLETSALGDYVLQKDDIIHCSVTEIISPKRGKRSASFRVIPLSYTSEDNTVLIKEKFYGKYSAKIISKDELKNVDAKKVGKKAAITVGNHFVKGVAPVASLAQGMIKNEDGNRLESGVKQVYKDSVLSYVGKGEELNIKPGQPFYLIFKSENSDNSDSDEE